MVESVTLVATHLRSEPNALFQKSIHALSRSYRGALRSHFSDAFLLYLRFAV